MKIGLDIIKFLSRLVEPRAHDEDTRRREFILNVLILGAISLILVALLTSTIFYLTRLSGDVQYTGIPITFIIILLSIFIGMYILSRKGYHKVASYLIILFYFIPSTYAATLWGVSLPSSLLMYALIIVMSGVLISTRFAWVSSYIITCILFLIVFLRESEFLVIDNSWKDIPFDNGDIIVLVFILLNIVVVSWLSNREIEKSLKRARSSEKALKKERDSLEIKVEERTKELRKNQEQRVAQLSRFAEFGRKTSSVIHDIVNPLTALNLNLQRIDKLDTENIKVAKEHLKDAIKASEDIQDYVGQVRQQLRQSDVNESFDIGKEIKLAVEMISFKADKEKAKITFEETKQIKYLGGPIQFRNVIANLISNAIDSYDKSPKESNKEVLVNLVSNPKEIQISVEDHGKGIRKEDLHNVFEPFYTTKSMKDNMGIGLSIALGVIKEEFGGTIDVESKEGQGTTFTIKLPVKKASKKKSKANA